MSIDLIFIFPIYIITDIKCPNLPHRPRLRSKFPPTASTDEIPTSGNEGEYLELADIFKEVVLKKDRQLKALYDRYLNVFKLLMLSYSSIRMADDLLTSIDFHSSSMTGLIASLEYTRAEISEFIDIDAKDDSDSDSE